MTKRTLIRGAVAGVAGTALLGIATYKALERRDRRTRARRAMDASVAGAMALYAYSRRRQQRRLPSFVRAPAATVRRVVPVG